MLNSMYGCDQCGERFEGQLGLDQHRPYVHGSGTAPLPQAPLPAFRRYPVGKGGHHRK